VVERPGHNACPRIITVFVRSSVLLCHDPLRFSSALNHSSLAECVHITNETNTKANVSRANDESQPEPEIPGHLGILNIREHTSVIALDPWVRRALELELELPRCSRSSLLGDSVTMRMVDHLVSLA